MIIGAALLIAFGVWWGLSTTPAASSALTTDMPAGPGQDVVDTLLTLRSIKLDGAIFSESAFTSLHDFSTQIVPEPVGRPNPFAPLGASGTTTSQAMSAQTQTLGQNPPPARAGAH